MKKLFVVFFAAFFSLGLIAQNAMAAEPSGEEMVTEIFTGSEEVPSTPLTAEEIAKAVKKEMGDPSKKIKKAVRDEAAKTAAAIDNVGTKIEKLSGKFSALDNVSQSINRVGLAVNRDALYLAIVMIVGFVIIILLVLRNGRSAHNLGETLDRVEKKVDEVPTGTAKLVKQLDPITIVVKVAGRNISFIPEIVDNTYRLPYVPKSAEDNADTTKIARARHTDPGVVHNSTRDVMKMYFSPGCPILQRKVIEHLVKTSALKIETIVS